MTVPGPVAAAAVAGAVAITGWGNLDYLREIRRARNDPDENKPRLVTWLIWAAALALGTAGAVQARQGGAAALGAVDEVTSLAVIAATWRYLTAQQRRDITWLDMAAAAGGGAGLALLTTALILPQLPVTAAITAAVITDVFAFLPTLKNAAEGGEPPGPYAWFGAAAALAALAATSPAGLIYPLYYVMFCGLAWGLATSARRRASAAENTGKEPAMTPELPADATQPIWPARPAHLPADPPYPEQTGQAVRGILAETWHVADGGYHEDGYQRRRSEPEPPPGDDREAAVRGAIAEAMAGDWHEPGPEPLARALAAAWQPPGDETVDDLGRIRQGPVPP